LSGDDFYLRGFREKLDGKNEASWGNVFRGVVKNGVLISWVAVEK